MSDDMIERVARAIAIAHGDAWEDVPDDKSHWTSERGQFGGRFRDVNENFKDCYRDEARAAIEAMREPTERMIDAADGPWTDDDRPSLDREYRMMIDAALGGSITEILPETPKDLQNSGETC